MVALLSMNLYIVCIILSTTFIGLVQSYTFTTIASNVVTGQGAKPLVINAAETKAYTVEFLQSIGGVMYEVDLSNGTKTQISTCNSPLCSAITLYNSQVMYGGWEVIYDYNSLLSGGANTKLYARSGGTYTLTPEFWAVCMVTDAGRQKIYIGAFNVQIPSSGSIWSLDTSSAFAQGSLVQLNLTLNGAYNPEKPQGLSLVGSNLYFVEYSFTTGKVCKVVVDPNSASYLVVTQIVTGITRLLGIAVDSAGTYAYVSTDSSVIYKVDLSATNTYTNIATSYTGACSGLIINNAGTFIFMMAQNNLVKLSLTSSPGPAPTSPSPPGPAPNPNPSPSPTASSSSESDQKKKLLFLLFLLVLGPFTCCACYYCWHPELELPFTFKGKNITYGVAKDEDGDEADNNKHKKTELSSELSSPHISHIISV